MSTRCQIEFCSGAMRRTVYRHWDGYPEAVIADLLTFLAWNGGCGDAEYAAANFLHWSKRELDERNCRLGFGVCQNDELHGDVEYYYIVRCEGGACTVSAHEIEHVDGVMHVGRLLAVAPFSFSSATFENDDHHKVGMGALPRVLLNGVWYFRDDLLREFRRCDNPHERITFDELLDAA